ncbi:MAG: LolA-related protein [Pseudomonadota bacterium]|nr:LolA-related protein [Pseudomonadota bacterium]
MTSGSAIKHLLLVVMFASLPVQSAWSNELELLMQDMTAVKHRTVQYKEEKQMELLDAPLFSEGTLEYLAPDKLIRTVIKPSRVRYIIDRKQVTIEKADKSRTRNLDQLPLVKTFVGSFRAILAGDLISLQKYYEIDFSGNRDQWEISLQPKNKKLAAYVSRLKVSGAGDKIMLYIVEDSNGDLTRMQLFSEQASEGEVAE